MKVLAINMSHHASVCVVEDGKIIFALENSRLSKEKYDNKIDDLLKYLKDNFYDVIVYTSFNLNNLSKINYHESYVKFELSKNNITYKQLTYFPHHHTTHAFSAFYNSGFKKAICLVIDNGGLSPSMDDKELGQEVLSIIKIDNNQYKDILKIHSNNYDRYIEKYNTASYSAISPACLFEMTMVIFKYNEPGAVMGRSSYGKEQLDIPKIYSFSDNKFNFNVKFLEQLTRGIGKNEEDYCYRIQKDSTDLILKYLKFIKERFPDYDICLSGGYFQNCMTNYQIIKKGYSIFVDPVSHDGGTCVGLAQHFYKLNTNKPVEKYNDLYLGPKYPTVSSKFLKNISAINKSTVEKKVDVDEVASLLNKDKIIALYQGRSEFGPRALGNRSLLYNPKDPLAKDKINGIKKREWFRPYAGTVLYEEKDEWFDFYGKEETKYMSYAVKIKDSKTRIIPGVNHIDNTCRVQTLKQIENPHFYNLIQEFKKVSNVPILLNTSLNIANKPLVETPTEAVDFLFSTEIDYLYFPDASLLVHRNVV